MKIDIKNEKTPFKTGLFPVFTLIFSQIPEKQILLK